jgi:predicted ATPase
MEEKIKIENFGGLKNLEFEVKRINVLIGPQASGKSICVKLLYFFKSFSSEMMHSFESEENKRQLDSKQKERFVNYFPRESWPKTAFRIRYEINGNFIIIERKQGKALNFIYSDEYKKLIKKGRKFYNDERKKLDEEPRKSFYKANRNARTKFYECAKGLISENSVYNQFFVPAGRSFYANIQSGIFSFLSTNKSLDPFLIEFGSFYENFKRMSMDRNHSARSKKDMKAFDDLLSSVLSGSYLREKDKDFIIHNDSRKVNLSNASSGQQETLPLAIVLEVLSNATFFSSGGATLYIEEPEAHLFPTAQMKVVQLLARTFNNQSSQFQVIVTTHSPYILSSFNNLIEAGKIIESKPDKVSEVYDIIPKEEILSPNDIVAYSIDKGKKVLLLDEDTRLISQTILDSVSDEIAINFGKLLDIEF